MEKVRIHFEGNTLECRPGTTVAAALWENGIRHLSHSPKYGRPRGVTCARGQCTACLMRVDQIPNVRTCELTVREGMDVSRQEAGAFYAAPMQKILAAGSAFFPVGFYYKWFTRPPFLSRIFLDGIRPMTGVGRLPGGRDTRIALPPAGNTAPVDRTPAANLGRFDTVIIGAGPSGLEAAATAVGRVLLLDEGTLLGGQRYGALRHLADQPEGHLDRFGDLQSTLARIEAARDSLAGREDLTFAEGTRVIAGYHPDSLLLRRGDELQTVQFDNLVWAAGALDTLGLFSGNDTPGVMGPRALYRLLVRDGLQVKGLKALLIGSGPDLWLSGALLANAGARVSMVVTGDGSGSGIAVAVALQWPLHTGLKLDEISERGQGRLQATFVPDSAGHDSAGARLAMETDLAVLCGRGKPAYDILYQLGAELALQPELGGFVLQPGASQFAAVGEAAGNLPGQNHLPGSQEETA